MSSYMTIYAKGKNEYVEIGCFSRSSGVYTALESAAHYGKVTLLTAEDLMYAISKIDTDIERIKGEIALTNKKKEDLLAHYTREMEETLGEIYRMNEDAEAYIKEELEPTKATLDVYQQILEWSAPTHWEDSKLVREPYLYFGIECGDPNKEKEDE